MGFWIAGPGTTIRFDRDTETVCVRTSKRSNIRNLERYPQAELIDSDMNGSCKIVRGVWALPFASILNILADGEWVSSFEGLEKAELQIEVWDQDDEEDKEYEDV